MTINNIINTVQSIRTPEFMSVRQLRAQLKRDLGEAPTLTTLTNWGRRKTHPKLENIAAYLSPNISFGIYYYPQVKAEVIKYYGKTTGRPKGAVAKFVPLEDKANQ